MSDPELIAALTRNAEAQERLAKALRHKARAERELAASVLRLADAVASTVMDEGPDQEGEGGLVIDTLSGPVRVS